MSTHYCLRVIRLEDLKWKHPLHRNDPNLYVEVRFGDVTRKTQVAKRTRSPIWNEELAFPAAGEISVFKIKVMHDSTFLQGVCVGIVDVNLVDVLEGSTEGEVYFEISSPERAETTILGRIVLQLSAIDGIQAIRVDIRGAAHAGGQHKPYKTIDELLQRLEKLEKVIGAVSEINSFSKIAWSLVSTLLKTVQNVFEADRKVVELLQGMNEAFEFALDVQTLRDKAAALQRPIEGLLKQTIECCIFVREYTSRSFAGRMREFDSARKINEFQESLVKFKKEIDSGVILHTAFVSVRAAQGIDKLLLQQQLNPGHFDAFDRPSCLPKTRLEIRKQIIEWLFSETTQNVFWLYGVAGSGKSTISATIAHHLRDMSRLGAFLFFERGKSEPSSVIRTIAYKLGIFDSSIGSSILSAIANDQDIATASSLFQFNKLLLEPLVASASSISGPIVVVLDALDECGTPETRRGLMDLLKREFSKLPNVLRFLITSRREADIDKALSWQPDRVCAIELDYTSTGSREDVLTYLRTEMDRVIGEEMEILGDSWPWGTNLQLLGKAAGGLFIWASTAVKMVENSNTRLKVLKQLVFNVRALSGLDTLYASVLRDSDIKWAHEGSRELFRKVLALVLLSKVPVSCRNIDDILGLSPDESSINIFKHLRSVLTYSAEGPVSLFHTSFSDYLLSPERSNEPWFIDPPRANRLIADRCFIVMKELLRFNMCDLKSSFVRNDDVPGLADVIETQIPSRLGYACLHWAQHLCDAPCHPELLEKLSDFAYCRVLFWFEVLSLMKAFGRVASSALHLVSSWVEDSSLADFLQDASRLASMFTDPIMQSTPHIYISMLPFSVDDSEIVAHYSRCISSTVHVERRGIKRPPMYLKVLEGHSGLVISVAFSPNGRHVVSASHDDAVLVRDIDSGEVICGPLEGRTACFSPDGSRIVSGSNDGTVRVWSTQNGSLVLGPLEGHTERVNSVAWSSDGTRIASDSDDKTIMIWDAGEGRAIFRLTGHTDCVTSIAFSPDSERLASGSEDKTIRIWDVNNGVLAFGPFEGHSGLVASVAYSPNGKLVVSGSDDRTVKVWEVESGNVVSTFEGHTNWVTSVAYSPCGSFIASGSWDHTIVVWDSKNGQIASGPFEDHTSFVYCVAYSPNGKYIASGSVDKTVRIWDASFRAISSESSQKQKHTDFIMSVAFSPDGRRIASASWDGSIIVWDAQTGDAVAGPLLGHTKAVICVAFLPDGLRLVSGSSDKTIRIWGAGSCEVVCGPLEGELTDNTCMTVSPDGLTLVFGPIDDAMRVWSIASDHFVAGPPLFHKKCIDSVAFSPSGKQFASGSGNTIKVWNTETWETTSELSIEQSGSLSSICFSPDDTHIVCIVNQETITIVDAVNGRITTGPFEGCKDPVFSVLLSHGGEYIISCSYEVIRISDTENGETILDLHGHMNAVWTIALSPDGSRLVSGSADNTIRVWDVSDLLRHPAESSSTSATTLSSSTGVFSDWVLDDDGWILGGPDGRDLLSWVPPHLRWTVCRPRCLFILSCDFSTKLDFTGASLGERWTECFISPE